MSNRDVADDSTDLETLDIELYEDRAGVWFCLVKPGHACVEQQLETVERKFGRVDGYKQVIEQLIPEPEREMPPPVIGTLTHKDGEIVEINFDISEFLEER